VIKKKRNFAFKFICDWSTQNKHMKSTFILFLLTFYLTVQQQLAPQGSFVIANGKQKKSKFLSGTFCCVEFGKYTVGRLQMLKENNSTKLPQEQRLWYRFEGYDASNGPSVYAYATEAPSSRSIAGGVRIQDSPMTQRGSFDIEILNGSLIFSDPLKYKGVSKPIKN
jgi:hypothetical protein